MTFLAIVIAVVLLQAWGSADRTQYDGWFTAWQARVSRWNLPAGVSLAAQVLLPTALALFLLSLAEPFLFGLFWVPLAALLLLYSFGRGDFQGAMGRYRGHVYSGDFEAAYLSACQEFEWEDAAVAPDSPLGVHALIQRAYLYEGLQRWFAVLFYFVLTGPAGALAYRLLQLSREGCGTGLVARLLFLLDWLPARLLAATFTLTGDFIASRDSLLAALADTGADAGPVLYTVGVAALGPDAAIVPDEDAVTGPAAAAQNREFNALLARSAACWIVVLSLLVLLL